MQKFPHSSIAAKLPIGIGVLLVVVLGGMTWAAYAEVRKSNLDVAAQRLASVSEQLGALFEASAQQRALALRKLAEDPAIVAVLAGGAPPAGELGAPGDPRASDLDPDAQARAVLEKHSAASQQSLAMELWDAAGSRVLVTGREMPGAPAAASGSEAPPTTRAATSGESVGAGVEAGAAAAAPAPGSAVVLGGFAQDGDVLFYRVATSVARDGVPLGRIAEVRRVASSSSASQMLTRLVGGDARLLIGTSGGLWHDLTQVVPPPPAEAVESAGAVEYEREGSEPVLGRFTTVAGGPWRLAVEFPLDSVLAPAHGFIRRAALFSLAFVIAGVGAGWWFSRLFTRPLESVTRAAEALAEGRIHAGVTAGRSEELHRLHKSFRTMAGKVEEGRARVTQLEREQEARMTAIFEAALDGIVTIDRAGTIVEANPAAERILGLPRAAAVGKSLFDLLLPPRSREERRRSLELYLADGLGRTIELDAARSDGSEFPAEISFVRIGAAEPALFTGFIRDVTERRQLESQLRQSQKMEAVGTLAGGIAHDFNNILGAIQGYAEFVQNAVPPDGEPAADIAEVLRGVERGRQLVQQILLFSRRQDPVRKPFDLAPSVHEAAKLLRASLPASIAMSVRTEDSTPTIVGDSTSIHQIVMNLATNAAHAMPEGGALEIVTDSVYLTDSFVRSHPEVHEGHYGRISVRDTGHGMDPAVASRAFEPFFTTKEAGRGTGLGLSMVHAIMRDHDGLVQLETKPGQGTTVRCYFPAVVEGASETSDAIANLPRGNGERVLIVDDEPMLARLGQRRLADLGYRVTVVTESTAAIERLQEAEEPFDVLVTDFYMPKMTGLELARKIAALRLGTGIVMLTGIVSELPEAELRAAGVHHVLSKPVTLAQLAQAVAAVLAQRRRGRPAEERAPLGE